MKVVLNSKTKKILAISGGVLVAVIVIAIVVYFATKPPNPADYQMYGKWIGKGANTRVEYIVYVPELKQRVYMMTQVADPKADLKMVTEDNKQARYITIKSTDIISKVFDPSKWNNGYNKMDGGYMVIKPSNYEIYGPKLNGSVTVNYVVYEGDATVAQAIFMAISGGLLIIVTQDSTKARTLPAIATDTPESLYRQKTWASTDLTVEDNNYLLRLR
jgi:hypothetical protein